MATPSTAAVLVLGAAAPAERALRMDTLQQKDSTADENTVYSCV